MRAELTCSGTYSVRTAGGINGRIRLRLWHLELPEGATGPWQRPFAAGRFPPRGGGSSAPESYEQAAILGRCAAGCRRPAAEPASRSGTTTSCRGMRTP